GIHQRRDPVPVTPSEPRADARVADALPGEPAAHLTHHRPDRVVVDERLLAAPVVLGVAVHDVENASIALDAGAGDRAQLLARSLRRGAVSGVGLRERRLDALGNAGTHRAHAVSAMNDHVELSVCPSVSRATSL